MLLSASAETEHPEAAATLIDFLVNDPVTGEIFGTNRGLPASETALEGAALEGIDQQIADYEASIADRLGDAPPVPVIGYGTLEEKFRQIGQELGFGTLTVDDAVDQFFTERSEERRVGKECVSKCRSRWAQYHSNKTQPT